MKRYLIFAGNDYYPRGGWGDFVIDCDTLAEALNYANIEYHDWYHIIDSTTGKIVNSR